MDTSFATFMTRIVVSTIRAQPDETPDERANRCKQAHTLWASYVPRDAIEQMLATQIVGSVFAAADCLQLAAATQDARSIARFNGQALAFQRATASAEKRLEKAQLRPDNALFEPDDAPPPEPLRQAPILTGAQDPIRREPEVAPETGLVAVLRKPEPQRNAEEQQIVATFHAHFEEVMDKMTWPYGKQPRKDSLKRETSYLVGLLDRSKGKLARQMKDEELAAGTALERMELAAKRGQEAIQREESGSLGGVA